MKRNLWILASYPPMLFAQTLVAATPDGSSPSAWPVLVLIAGFALIGGAIVLRIKNPVLFAKLAGSANKAIAEAKPTAQHLEEEAKAMADALLHHPLAQPKSPPPVYVPPVAPAAVLELPPSANDGILR